MAIGAALLFNIKLPINFNSPYKALDIQDFWRRWHITLSRFLKDYIYIPLGGNRKGNFRTYNNLLATFVIGGLWHGAGWTFVFWGFLHGMALVIHRLWKKLGLTMNKYLAWFITFNFINIAWVFFRAKEWDDAIKVIKGMFGFSIVIPNHFFTKSKLNFEFLLSNIEGTLFTIVWLLFSFIICLIFKNSINLLKDFKLTLFNMVLTICLLYISFFHIKRYSEFIYFQF